MGHRSTSAGRSPGKGKYLAVLYMHGRRGLDDLIQLQLTRLAARGFVVLAPDIYKAHFLPPMPIEHDYKLEANVNDGVAHQDRSLGSVAGDLSDAGGGPCERPQASRAASRLPDFSTANHTRIRRMKQHGREHRTGNQDH